MLNINFDVNALAQQAGEALAKVAEQAGTTGSQLLTIAVWGTRMEGYVHLVWAVIGLIGIVWYLFAMKPMWKWAFEEEEKATGYDRGNASLAAFMLTAVWVLSSSITFGLHLKPAILGIYAPEYVLLMQVKEAMVRGGK